MRVRAGFSLSLPIAACGCCCFSAGPFVAAKLHRCRLTPLVGRGCSPGCGASRPTTTARPGPADTCRSAYDTCRSACDACRSACDTCHSACDTCRSACDKQSFCLRHLSFCLHPPRLTAASVSTWMDGRASACFPKTSLGTGGRSGCRTHTALLQLGLRGPLAGGGGGGGPAAGPAVVAALGALVDRCAGPLRSAPLQERQ